MILYTPLINRIIIIKIKIMINKTFAIIVKLLFEINLIKHEKTQNKKLLNINIKIKIIKLKAIKIKKCNKQLITSIKSCKIHKILTTYKK